MVQIVPQSKRVEALKLFNNAIVTSRLYPPETPQVANAVERGYKGIKQYLSEWGELSFAFRDSAPSVCGVPLDQEALGSFSNLIVFRQLKTLGLAKLRFDPEMDRFAFGQLLAVFIATPEKIKVKGGGLPFITNLGLAGYFAETDEEDQPALAEEAEPTDSRPRRTVKLQPELVAGLCGLETRAEIEEELTERLASPETATELLVAGVACILADIQKKKAIFASPSFTVMLQRAEKAVAESDRSQVAGALAAELGEKLKEPALCVVLSQEYPAGFGAKCYEALVASLKNEVLGGIFVILREQLAKANQKDGAKSPRVEFFGKVCQRLMNTGRGKQFLGSEKAKALIHEGEAARRKKRLESGIQGLVQGNLALLQSEELVQYLPGVVRQMLAAGENPGGLVRAVVEYYSSAQEGRRESLLACMMAIGERLVAGSRWDLLDPLQNVLLQIISRPTVSEPLLAQIVTFLHLVMQSSWQGGDLRRGDAILTTFFRLRTDQIGKSPEVKALIAKVQDRGIQRTWLPELLTACLAAPDDQALGNRLALQGPVAVRFLVEALINTDKAADRRRITELLTISRSLLAPIIVERLPENMPWYGKRNLLKLLAETGNETYADSVLPFLRHEDFRIQREAFLCLNRIAGRRRKDLLLDALGESSEAIKPEIIAALAALCDAEVAGQLSQLLADYEVFSEANRAELMLRILDTLGRSPSQEAYTGVENFLQLQGGRAARKKIPEEVWPAAEKTLKTIDDELQEAKKKHIQASQLRKNAIKQAATLGKTGKAGRIVTGLPQEQAVRTLLARGELDGAREQLLQLIEKVARTRNFLQAEHLRDWFVEIDPQDVSHIIQATEIIDREKAAAINKSHLEIWSGLYDVLTTQEFGALYHSLKQKTYLDEEVIVSQGTLQTSLFFINSGKVKFYYEGRGDEALVRTMGSGEMFGAAALVDASSWTVSAASVGTSEISLVKLDKLQEWREEYPGLVPKLEAFCRTFEQIEEFVARSAEDRRRQERHRLNGRVSTLLLDNHAKSVGLSSMVELIDISAEGLSCLARLSRKEHARLLLGRKVQVKLPIGGTAGGTAALTGDILTMKNTPAVANDYSVHVRFDKRLAPPQLQAIEAAAGSGAPVAR